VLIIGDPMQLTHVTTMTAATEADCRTRAGIGAGWLEQRCLAYRRHSAFRAFDNAADETLLLDEHYRCHPVIAEISNRLFYGSQLTVLTDVSRLCRIDDKPVTWQPVLGVPRQPRGGSWYNEAEAHRVSDVVRQLQARLPAEATIGVVTPFRPQRELISKLCKDTNVRVGPFTPSRVENATRWCSPSSADARCPNRDCDGCNVSRTSGTWPSPGPDRT
jgi:AAA domain